ncbi:hypothetical protein ACH5AU_31300 [Streptomyces albidoflavus]
MIAGRGPSPALVGLLVARLPDTSLTHALAAGGREHLGWGQDRHLAADLYDAVGQLTRAAGNWSKKPPDIPQYPRPSRAKTEKTPVGKPSVAALYAQFTGR